MFSRFLGQIRLKTTQKAEFSVGCLVNFINFTKTADQSNVAAFSVSAFTSVFMKERVASFDSHSNQSTVYGNIPPSETLVRIRGSATAVFA